MNHRDYYHMNDNDYSVASESFVGLAANIRIRTNLMGRLFWWFGTEGFCETIDSDRTYEFSIVETYGNNLKFH